MSGWALKERLDKEKAEEEEEKRGGPRAGPTLGGFWIQRTGAMAGFGGGGGTLPQETDPGRQQHCRGPARRDRVNPDYARQLAQ